MNPPETALLIACARRNIGGDPARQAREALAGIRDWDRLLAAADHHGLLPLLAHHLTGRLCEHVPETVCTLLKEGRHRTALVMTFLFQETLRILSLFEKNSLQALPFKGPILADRCYGDVSLRPPGDLDFITDLATARKARDLLTAEGYRPYFSLTPPEMKAFERYYYAFTLYREDSRITVDLHWELSRRFFPRVLAGLDYGARAGSIPLSEGTVTVFGAEDLILLLSLHGFKHRWERLLWLTDIREVIDGSDVDWSSLVRIAREQHAARALGAALSLATRILQAEVPAAVLKELGSSAAVVPSAGPVDGAMSRVRRGAVARTVGKALFQLKYMDRFRDRARFILLWTFLPNINDWRWIRLPGWCFFLHGLLRPVRITFDYGSRLLSSLGRGFSASRRKKGRDDKIR